MYGVDGLIDTYCNNVGNTFRYIAFYGLFNSKLQVSCIYRHSFM